MRQYMHQHPFEAPALPKRSSSAGHSSDVTRLIVRSIITSSVGRRCLPSGLAARASDPCRVAIHAALLPCPSRAVVQPGIRSARHSFSQAGGLTR
jgi:hypothetical protein